MVAWNACSRGKVKDSNEGRTMKSCSPKESVTSPQGTHCSNPTPRGGKGWRIEAEDDREECTELESQGIGRVKRG